MKLSVVDRLGSRKIRVNPECRFQSDFVDHSCKSDHRSLDLDYNMDVHARLLRLKDWGIHQRRTQRNYSSCVLEGNLPLTQTDL